MSKDELARESDPRKRLEGASGRPATVAGDATCPKAERVAAESRNERDFNECKRTPGG